MHKMMTTTESYYDDADDDHHLHKNATPPAENIPPGLKDKLSRREGDDCGNKLSRGGESDDADGVSLLAAASCD